MNQRIARKMIARACRDPEGCPHAPHQLERAMRTAGFHRLFDHRMGVTQGLVALADVMQAFAIAMRNLRLEDCDSDATARLAVLVGAEP